MSRYRVTVTRSITYEVEVEAPAYYMAEKAAESVPPEDITPVPVTELPRVETRAVCQLGEPWVYGWSGEGSNNSYHGRPDSYLEVEDLLVFRRSFGNQFSKEDIALLQKRIEEVVGPVQDSWRAFLDGASAVSFKLEKSFGVLTDVQVKALMAPR